MPGWIRLLAAVSSVSVTSVAVAQSHDCFCAGNTPNAGMQIECGAPSCVCWNDCAEDSASAGAADSMIFIVLTLVVFPVAPTIYIEAIAGQPVFGSTAGAREEWQAHLRSIEAAERIGRAEHHPPPPDSAASAPPAERVGDGFAWHQPLDTTRSLDFACNQAAVLLPTHVGGPIAGFPSEDAMVAACLKAGLIRKGVPFAPVAAGKCGAGQILCHRNERCCPQTHPHYNPCDKQCYPSPDYRASHEAHARRCGGENCTVWLPAP